MAHHGGDGDGGIPPPGANFVAMQHADIVALAQLLRVGATKLRRMTEATPEAWLEYKRHFLKVAQLQNWDDERSRRELAAGMQEKAGNAVADIEVDQPVINIDILIALYEERFLPAAAGATARKNYQSAKQLPTESVRDWHTRVRELFFLAYPGEDPNAQNHCLDLFVNGLANPTVKFFVASQDLANFAPALPVAERAETANRDNLGQQGRGGGAMHAIRDNRNQPGPRGPLACYFCLDVFKIESPHTRNNCPYFKAAYQLWQTEQGNPATGRTGAQSGNRGGGANRGGNRSGGRGGRGGQRGARSVNTVEGDSSSQAAAAGPEDAGAEN